MYLISGDNCPTEEWTAYGMTYNSTTGFWVDSQGQSWNDPFTFQSYGTNTLPNWFIMNVGGFSPFGWSSVAVDSCGYAYQTISGYQHFVPEPPCIPSNENGATGTTYLNPFTTDAMEISAQLQANGNMPSDWDPLLLPDAQKWVSADQTQAGEGHCNWRIRISNFVPNKDYNIKWTITTYSNGNSSDPVFMEVGPVHSPMDRQTPFYYPANGASLSVSSSWPGRPCLPSPGGTTTYYSTREIPV